MALSDSSSRVPAGFLHIDCIPRDHGSSLRVASPAFGFYGDLKNCFVSIGPPASKPKAAAQCGLEVVHFDAYGNSNQPSITLTGGNVLTCQGTVTVIKRTAPGPIDGLRDLFQIAAVGHTITTLASNNFTTLAAGDVIIFPTGSTPLHGWIGHAVQRMPLDMQKGFGVLILLPEIQDTDKFQANVIHNIGVIHEIRDYIDEFVGCWDAVYSQATGYTDFVMADDRGAVFHAKTYDRLFRLDSIYENGSSPHYSVASGSGSKKRKAAAGAGTPGSR